MANITKVYLLSVPLEDDYKDTLYFANATAQQTYFAGQVVKSYTDFSYQRKDNVIRVPAQVDTIRNCNYVMYQNTAYSNKWFYCFIEKMTYVNDNMTDVEFKVDPIQTFMFDFETQPSFIEREHTNDDTVGANLLPENLELGEYVANGAHSKGIIGFGGPNRYMLRTSYYPDGTVMIGSNIDGIPAGGGLIGFMYWQQMQNAIQKISAAGHLEDIKEAFIIPDDLSRIEPTSNQYWSVQGDTDENLWWKWNGTTSPYFLRGVYARPNTIDGYNPRNKKLLTAPFQFLMLTNNNGSVTSLNYEYFSNPSSFVLEAKGTICVGGSAIVYPENYKHVEKNYNEAISQGKFPTLSWSGDAYTNWLTQNAVNLNLGVIGDTLNLATGIGTTGQRNDIGFNRQGTNYIPESQAGNFINFGMSIADKVANIYQHSICPQTVRGNTNCGDVLTSDRSNSVYVIKMSIRSEFAQIIDSYFDAYGYSINKIKKPNYAHRQNWWYTKTIGVYIKGNIPNEYMNEIKNAYNNGITYWRNPSNFMNYSVSNGIV